MPLLLLYRSFDEEVLAYPADSATARDVRVWLELHLLPLLGEVGPHNFELYEQAQQRHAELLGEAAPPLVWLFLNASCCEDENGRIRQILTSEARERRGDAIFMWLDGDRYAHHARSLAATPGVLPVLAAEAGSQHYVYASSLHSAAGVHAWVDLVLRGALRPTLRSAPPPLHNLGPVHVVVAATLDELVLQSHRDVLLLVHAPWCTSCAPLHSELHKLATRYADTAERLMIATYDAGLNDVPRTLPVDRMPTLLFFTGEPNHADGAGGSAAGGAAGSAAEGGGEVASVDAVTRVPIDLSELCTAHELSDALVRHAKAPLRAPTDVAQLQQALAMLPRFQREAQTLLEENERLRTELAEARRQVALAAPTGEPAP